MRFRCAWPKQGVCIVSSYLFGLVAAWALFHTRTDQNSSGGYFGRHCHIKAIWESLARIKDQDLGEEAESYHPTM